MEHTCLGGEERGERRVSGGTTKHPIDDGAGVLTWSGDRHGSWLVVSVGVATGDVLNLRF